MLSCDDETVRACKRLTEDGFALPLGEAIALESGVNRSRPRTKPDQIAARLRSGGQLRSQQQIT